jgi:uncharacterized protein
MLPTYEEIKTLHRKYAEFVTAPGAFSLIFEHCQAVNDIALWCAKNTDEPVNTELLQAAALLHDIGSYPFVDADGAISGQGFYPQHAILGAKILLDEGLNPRIAQIVETHLLLGLTKDEIEHPRGRKWALPARDYEPQSVEAELLCYADRFHSKGPNFNSYASFYTSLEENLPQQAAKFKAMSERFGVPDLVPLAKKYRQPIK